jgi:hypothetical protein
MFVKAIHAHFECDTHYLRPLTELCQTYIVIEFIVAFEQLAIHINGMSNSLFKYCFIGGLEEAMKAQVMMQCPTTWLEDCKRDKEAKMVINVLGS